MPELCNSELVESLAAALETMAFVTLAPPEELVAPPDDAVLARVEFAERKTGQNKGYAELATSESLGRLLVDNTLSCDSSETPAMPSPHDPLVEVLNIACGLALKRAKPGMRLEMRTPTVSPITAEQWQQFLDRGACDLLLADEFPIAIRLVER